MMSQVTERPPMPGEWHPAYADKPWLADWLNRRGDYANSDMIVLPTLKRRLVAEFGAADEGKALSETAFGRMTMTLKKAAGPAPFVGDPLWTRGFYEWRIGVDDAGRTIAGDAELVLIDGPTF